jgi:hypothetical protein
MSADQSRVGEGHIEGLCADLVLVLLVRDICVHALAVHQLQLPEGAIRLLAVQPRKDLQGTRGRCTADEYQTAQNKQGQTRIYWRSGIGTGGGAVHSGESWGNIPKAILSPAQTTAAEGRSPIPEPQILAGQAHQSFGRSHNIRVLCQMFARPIEGEPVFKAPD